MENNRRGNEIFLGVIGVATLVVAIIGATFAFFSASASSSNGAVAANSANVALGYVDNVNTNIKYNLIPASESVATYAALNQDENTAHDGGKNDQCVDDLGNEVCSVYEFTVSNPATIPQDITISLDVSVNGFENLKYKVYEGTASDLTNASTAAVPAAIFPQADDTLNNPVTLLNNVTLTTSSPDDEKTYTIVIWLNDTNTNQSAGAEADAQAGTTDEADKSFAATITVTSASGGVSGQIRAVDGQQNPS